MTKTTWWETPTTQPNSNIAQQAQQHQNQLTKPAGSLGFLEQFAIQLSAIQNTLTPTLDRLFISVFAGDHGIVESGISAFPQSVTVEMQRNFIQGGAAISVLAKQLNAHLEVINTGTAADPEQLPGVIHASIASQTQNFLTQPAMTESQWEEALLLGQQAIFRAKEQQAQLFIGGEMGIGNTTSATAILAALFNIPATDLTGPGTGLNTSGIIHKTQVIEQALNLHREELISPQNISQTLGGFEITALSGAYIASAQAGIPVLVDGFICTASAAIALALNPSIRPFLFFSHCSAEPGHVRVLNKLQQKPIIDLNLRLGEGSGAAVIVPLLQMACALHNNMATFAHAAVSKKLEQ